MAYSLWVAACRAGLTGAGNAGDFLVVVPGRPWSDCPVSRWLESVFFAFVKFIMCLMVPEVKAVSCASELVVQVLELHKKKRFFSMFRKGPEQPFPGPRNDAWTAALLPPEPA